jgi:hypothetical protein
MPELLLIPVLFLLSPVITGVARIFYDLAKRFNKPMMDG